MTVLGTVHSPAASARATQALSATDEQAARCQVRFNRNGSAIATLKLFLYNLQVRKPLHFEIARVSSVTSCARATSMHVGLCATLTASGPVSGGACQEQAKVMPAILKFKRKIILVQSLIRGFLTRVRNANAHNSALWDKVFAPGQDLGLGFHLVL